MNRINLRYKLALGTADTIESRRAVIVVSSEMLALSKVDPILTEATDCFLSGNLSKSEVLCAEFLQSTPNHALGVFLQGLILSEKRMPEAALPFVEQAVILEPENFSFHLTLANLRAQLGQQIKARHAMLTAKSLCPRDFHMLLDLASSLEKAHLLREAQHCYQQAIQLDPSQAIAHYGLAAVLTEIGDHEGAIKSYRKSLECDARHTSSYNNLANLLAMLGRFEEAEQCYLQGLRADPNHAEICFNLANLYVTKGRLPEADRFYRKATAIRPSLVEAWDSLGTVLNDSGHSEDALPCFNAALELKPNWPQALWNKAITLLKMGRFQEGWEAYESRHQIHRIIPPRCFQAPRWEGQPFQEEKLLLVAEQGLGDTIQFVRYVAQAKTLGGQILLECQSRLARLMRSHPAIDQVLTRGEELTEYHWYCPLMSLPHIMKTTLATIPRDVPYLNVENPVQFPLSKILHVGLAWAGNSKHAYDNRRSCRLLDLSGLFDVQGIQWINLQQPFPEIDLHAAGNHFELQPRDHQCEDLYETAQWISSLDLVITVDTVVAHLAGALNVPVWILLSTACDWRWLTEREDSPWYPSAILFRQKQLGDWKEVVGRVKARLQDFAHTKDKRQPSS